MSPTIATVFPSSEPQASCKVNASSSACDGCSCEPSPALITEQPTARAQRAAAPEDEWRMTTEQGPIAAMFCTLSSKVSPFETDVPRVVQLSTSAPRDLAAISNDERVRVESSKKRF